jgi:predicted short-subunit dehydrogenase-like oxidoreductase (DUF2520 family)
MMPTISIIGAGNVAWHLVNRLAKAGFDIKEVCGRKREDAALFKSLREGLLYISDLKSMSNNADIYILCVSDDAIGEVLKSIPFKFSDKQILIHTSGSVPSTILSEYATHFGVLWPVMSLTKNVEPQYVDTIPYVITSSNDYVTNHLEILAGHMSNQCTIMPDEKRIQLHLAAVMANNFSNHLYTLTEAYCQKKELNFDLLKDIIRETAYKIQKTSPSLLQTGPAKRKDKLTIEKQLRMLEDQPELYKIYCLFTDSIIQKYNPE